MTLFLGLSAALSLAVLLGAAAMERAAILRRIGGANGLVILVALIASGLGALAVAAVAGWVGGWRVLLAVLAGAALWHAALGAALLGGLQALATRIAAEDRAPRPGPRARAARSD